jgi:hypothetical protein
MHRIAVNRSDNGRRHRLGRNFCSPRFLEITNGAAMSEIQRAVTRREIMAMAAVCITSLPTLGYEPGEEGANNGGPQSAGESESKHTSEPAQGEPMQIHYLEVVTKNVDAACNLYSALYGVSFADPDPNLGGARGAAGRRRNDRHPRSHA